MPAFHGCQGKDLETRKSQLTQPQVAFSWSSIPVPHPPRVMVGIQLQGNNQSVKCRLNIHSGASHTLHNSKGHHSHAVIIGFIIIMVNFKQKMEQCLEKVEPFSDLHNVFISPTVSGVLSPKKKWGEKVRSLGWKVLLDIIFISSHVAYCCLVFVTAHDTFSWKYLAGLGNSKVSPLKRKLNLTRNKIKEVRSALSVSCLITHRACTHMHRQQACICIHTHTHTHTQICSHKIGLWSLEIT